MNTPDHNEVAMGDTRQVLIDQADATEPTPEEVAAHESDRAAVAEAFERLAPSLSDRELEVIQLRYFGEGQQPTKEQVAAELGLASARSVTTAERHVFQKLEALLEHDGFHPAG